MSNDQAPPAAGGVREIRQRASERLGRWVRKKYRLDSLLGVGGMAAVYASTHRNGSRMAIKMLHGEFANDESVRERFLREGYVANKVSHPGRVAIIDDDETEDGEPFLVMELLDGLTLQQVWKKQNRKLDIAQAMGVAEQILDTLIPFHELNIIHRDLKPANIFITKNKEVKLLDFGVAQFREDGEEALTHAGSALGTPSYMSPEQAMGKSDTLDGRSDVYAIGATLYTVLSGNRLYHDKSDNEAFILAATQPAPSIARVAPELPVEVLTLVDKALQWDRRNRYPNAQAMRDACRKLAQRYGGSHTGAASTTPGTAAPSPATSSSPPAGLPERHMLPTPQTAPTAQTAPGSMNAILTPLTISSPAPSSIPGAGSLSPASFGSASGSHAMDSASAPSPKTDSAYTAKLKEIFTLLERAIPTLRQYADNHPETVSKVGSIHRAVVSVLRTAPHGISWAVHPFCFSVGGTTVWEPEPPADGIPYTLSAAGVEEITWLPGITEQELRVFCVALMSVLNPKNEDVDIAELLWEARIDHVRVELGDDIADGNDPRADRSLTETDDLEALAREDLAEAAAMALATNAGAAASATTQAWALDPQTRTAFASQFSLDAARWNDRYLDVLVAGYVDSVDRGDPALVLGALAARAERLIRKGAYRELFVTHHALLERLAASHPTPEASCSMLTAGIYSESVLKTLLSAVHNAELPKPDQQTILDILRYVSATLDVRAIHGCLKLANRLPKGEPLTIMLEYIQRASKGNEQTTIDHLETLRPTFAQTVLCAIANPKTPEGAAMLRPLLDSPIAALRCEAIALLASSPEQLKQMLLKLAEGSDPHVLLAALNTIVRHHVRAAGPGLIRLVEHDQFLARPREQQQQIFETLWSLNSKRGERVLISVIEQMHGLMADDHADRTRALAADILSEHSSSDEAIEALSNATRRRPWNTPELRTTAAKAIVRIKGRLNDEAVEETNS